METLCTLNQKSKLNHIYTYIYIIYIYYTYIYKYHIYIYIYIYIYIHNFETTICILIYIDNIDNFKKFKRVTNFSFLFIEVHYRNKTEFKKTEKFWKTVTTSRMQKMQRKVKRMFLKQLDPFYLKIWFPTNELI